MRSQTLYNAPQASSSLAADASAGFAAAQVSPATINRANLILSPQTLDPNLSYIFRLTAENDAGSSFAEIVIETDSPPTSVDVTVTPTSGVAMETEFEVTVLGALDSAEDSPFLYQFGIIQEGSGGVRDVLWISGVQSSPSLQTVLPSGAEERNYTLAILSRVFDRKGGYTDTLAEASILPNPSVSDGFFNDRLRQLQEDLARSKDWRKAVSQLVAYLSEINKNVPASSQNLKEQSFEIFTAVLDTYIFPSSPHYLMASSLFSLITTNQGIQDAATQRQLSSRVLSIAEWFKNETALEASFVSIPSQGTGQPLFLQSSYPSPEEEPLSDQEAAVVLSPWINMLEMPSSSDPEVSRTFARGSEVVGSVLCQQSSTGEHPSSVSTSLVTIHTVAGIPMGLFNLSGHLGDFGSSVLSIYQSVACQGEGVPCLEACVAGISFSHDLSVERTLGERQRLRLETGTRQKIANAIEGSNPQAMELISDVLSLSISIPFQDAYLSIRDLATPIRVLIPVPRTPLANGSVPLCVYREVGGASGFESSYEWLLDNTTSPSIVEIGSKEFFSCPFYHLSEFAIGVLPPPVITVPPPTEDPSTMPPPTTMTTPRTPATTPTVVTESATSPAGPIAAVVVILVVVVAAAVVIAIVFLCYRNKKRKMRILPDESSSEEKPEAELLQAGPLTPAESKIPMDIIQCLEEGKRTRMGKMNVLPSIRLRELRFDIVDHFTSLKNKPFYFLTRQLCDIDPTTEQQQFVSIVFGDKPIFIREVTAENLQTKKHFCVCGNAALFECSNCLSQGYCSPECQHSHWADKHQKECSRLSERKRRTDVLYNRQSSSVPPTSLALSPITETPQRGAMGLASPTSPTSPTDWKGFMSLKRTAPTPQGHFPPSRTRAVSVPAPPQNITSLGTMAKRLSVQPDQGPSTKTTPNLGPLKRVPGAFNLPADSANTSRPQQRPSFIGTPLSLGVAAASSSYGRSLLQSPQYPPTQGPFVAQPSPLGPQTQGAFFTRPPPQPPRSTAPALSRQLSIQSVGSADFATSPHAATSTSIRSAPLLESDEGDYSSSGSDASSEGEEKGGRKSASSRPPSLAVRRRDSRVSESSSSEDESSEEEGSNGKTNSQ